MKLLIPLLFLILGAGGGIGAGLFLKPDPVETELADPCGDYKNKEPDAKTAKSEKEEAAEPEYVELNNQFVVPIVGEDIVESLVVLAIGIEVDEGATEVIYKREPKLRDTLLQVLFDHANIGGFAGRFTDGNNMDVLRISLTEAAQGVVGEAVRGVIITDIARQDI